MKKTWIPLLSLLILAACGPNPAPYYPTIQAGVYPDAAATLAAADLTRQQAAGVATAQSGEVTRQVIAATEQAQATQQIIQAIATGTAQSITQAQTATAESITVRASEQALSAQATYAAIAANATGTAVAHVAQAEQHLIEDEARRLALQRQAEAEALAYQERINRIKPYLWGAGGVALIILAGGISYTLYQRSRPITVTDISGPRVLVPANGWQVLPVHRPQRALPEPTSEPAPINTPIPLPPLTQGHVLIAGETGSGKSTAMLAVLRRRPQVIVLDPHDTPGSWGNAQVIGGGRNFAAIGQQLQQMRQLLSQRYQQRAQGLTRFDAITIATDEMPAIVAALGGQVDEIWREWLREGRKVGLFFAVSTQSTRVKTLGIRGEGDLLENFTYILLLGKVAANQYPDLVQGMERPAVLRTVQGIRPVLIPLELPDGSQTIAPALAGNEALDVPEGFADPNNLTEATRDRIRRLAQALPSQAAIERAVFGYNGGAAYRAVKEVLDGSNEPH